MFTPRCSRVIRRCFSTSPPTVGFIGLGQMGFGMASNLVTKGHKVLAFDVIQENVDRGVSVGMSAASSISEIGEKCGIVVTMLRTPQQVTSVYDELFSTCAPNSLFIDSSTVDPATSQSVAAKGNAKNVQCVDAPVSGGVPAAAAGTLTFMVGGPKDSYDLATNYLNKMGANVFHCGDKSGSGQITKICNNLILGISMNAVAEGLSMGVKLGMDPKVLSEILSVSTSNCWSLSKYNPAPGVLEGIPSANQYNGGFVCDLMLKDLELALEAAKTVDHNLEFGTKARDVYQEMSKNFGNKDFGVVYQRAKGDLENDLYTA